MKRSSLDLTLFGLGVIGALAEDEVAGLDKRDDDGG
jgi:hypothetical protein